MLQFSALTFAEEGPGSERLSDRMGATQHLEAGLCLTLLPWGVVEGALGVSCAGDYLCLWVHRAYVCQCVTEHECVSGEPRASVSPSASEMRWKAGRSVPRRRGA